MDRHRKPTAEPTANMMNKGCPFTFFYHVFYNSIIPMAVWKETGEITAANKIFLELVGYTRAELEDKAFNLISLTPPIYAERDLQALNEISEQGFCRPYEKAFCHKKGHQVPILIYGGYLNSREDRILFVTDLTTCRQGEEMLRESEKKYRGIVEAAQEGIVLFDREFRILFANEMLGRMLGADVKELLGQSLLVFIDRESQAAAQKNLKKRCAGIAETVEYRFVDKNGSKFWANANASPVLDDKGKFICVMFTISDITAHKQAEIKLKKSHAKLEQEVKKRTAELSQANKILQQEIAERLQAQKSLAESETFYRTLVENANEAIIVIKGRFIRFANPMAEKVLSCSLEKLKTLPFREFVHPDDRHLISERIEKRLHKGKLENPFNYRLIDYDGHVKHIQENSVNIKWEGSDAILALLTDITILKKMENEICKADKLDAVGILAGGIAHDFNNYLAIILANVNLAKLYCTDNNISKTLVKLENLEKATLRAKNLSGQLFTFARGGSPVKEKVFPGPLLADNIQLALSGSPVHPDIQLDKNLFQVEVDTGQFSQVLQNIIINAVQAMPEGGNLQVQAKNVKLSATGEKSSMPLPPGPYVKITITDEGIGIPEKYLQKIFDPFFTTKNKGRGLGLATSYSIIKKHSGHIDVESAMGAGTVFAIHLPAVEEIAAPQPADIDLLPGTGKILVMDDEEDLLQVLEDSLSTLGYDVTLSRDGRQAIKLYARALEQNQPFDLVILDLTIPGGLGGKQTIKKLRALDPAVKAVVVSGYSDDPVLARYHDFGFKGMVEKPFTIAELSQIVGKAIGQPLEKG
jgi:PAS domain S-box-containing protein